MKHLKLNDDGANGHRLCSEKLWVRRLNRFWYNTFNRRPLIRAAGSSNSLAQVKEITN